VRVLKQAMFQGMNPESLNVRCVTFGSPQVADRRFWMALRRFWCRFDSYIFGDDFIFRASALGGDLLKKVIVGALKLGAETLSKVVLLKTQPDETTKELAMKVVNIVASITVPKFCIFGRHHFLRFEQDQVLSIGTTTEEVERILGTDLNDESQDANWWSLLRERKAIREDQFAFAISWTTGATSSRSAISVSAPRLSRIRRLRSCALSSLLRPLWTRQEFLSSLHSPNRPEGTNHSQLASTSGQLVPTT